MEKEEVKEAKDQIGGLRWDQRVERLERAVLGLAMLNGEFQTIVKQPEYDKLRRSLRSDLLALLDQMRGDEGE
jgi:hypothetical protein